MFLFFLGTESTLSSSWCLNTVHQNPFSWLATVQGVTIKNSACWVQTYELCNNLVIDQVNVESRAFWNNDGMDITDCRNVRITNCDINSADDGICLKSYYPGYFNDSIYIANCYIRSSASAIKFGTASVGGFKNVVIDNITVKDTYRSAIAIESVDGGFIENVQVSNITAVNTGNAIFVRLGHRAGETPGTVKNISFKNIKVQVPFGRPDEAYDMRGPDLPFFHNQFPSPITGIPGHYIENISFENIEIIYTDYGKIKTSLRAPLLERFAGENPKLEFPKGLNLVFYDSLQNPESSLKADYAIHDEKENKIIAKSNVEVINEKGEKLNTEKLIWERVSKQIYTDEFVTITTEDELIMGEGLISNESFTKYSIKKIKGTINLKEEQEKNE
jgi:LPS export ABC transporter protein LptC